MATGRDNAVIVFVVAVLQLKCWSNSALLVTLAGQEYVEFLFECRSSVCVTKSVTSLSLTAEAKAAEATASAYYSPVNPHNVYMPPVSSCVILGLQCEANMHLAVLFLSDTAKFV